MVYLVSKYDVLCLWWDKRSEYRDGYKYKITVDDTSVVYTTQVYYDFKCVEPGTTHTFKVQLVDENNQIVGKAETYTGSTWPKKTKIDITKEPYNAIGDGVFDNTEIFKRALDECSPDKYIFVPFGTYVCGKITVSGNKKLELSAGAIICNKEMVNKL